LLEAGEALGQVGQTHDKDSSTTRFAMRIRRLGLAMRHAK
jgi:hypothetical protein